MNRNNSSTKRQLL